MAPAKDPLIKKGAMLGIVGDLFRPYSAIFNAGLTANPDTPPTALKFSERRDLQMYAWLTSAVPLIVDDIRQNGPERLEEISQALDLGRTQVRGTDLHGVKNAIPLWRNWNPPIFEENKNLRGFNHHQIAALLANKNIDLDDPMAREGLRNGSPKYNVKAGNLANFLWEKERVEDPDNLWKGFGYGPLPVLALRYSILGPRAATLTAGGRIASRKPKAHIYRIRTITSGCIAYAAVLVHFALSSQDQFSATGYGNKFNYEKFYQRIISAIEEHMPSALRNDLLAWWNGKIFSAQYMDSSEDEDEDGEDDTIFAQMVQQATTAAPTAEDTTANTAGTVQQAGGAAPPA